MATHNLITTLQNGARARLQSISLPYSKASVGIASVLMDHGFVHTATRGTREGPSAVAFNNASPGMRRLWVDVKYGTDDRSVLGHANVVSKPSRRIFLDAAELLRLVTGRRAQFVNPLRLGEIAIVRCLVPVPVTTSAVAANESIVQGVEGEKGQETPADEVGTAIATATGEAASARKTRLVEQWLEAREAVGRGLSGEVIARVG